MKRTGEKCELSELRIGQKARVIELKEENKEKEDIYWIWE